MTSIYKSKHAIFVTTYGQHLPVRQSSSVAFFKLFSIAFTFVLGIGLLSRYSTASTTLVENTSLEYPLRLVSKDKSCRSVPFVSHNDACKVTLPRIVNAKYGSYVSNDSVKTVYSVLFGDQYASPWGILPNGELDFEGRHEGIDLMSAKGTPVYAIADGIVTDAKVQGGYGNVVKYEFQFRGKIRQATNAHLDTIDPSIKVGSPVKKGQQIGTIGNSGVPSESSHLHFEINIPQKGGKYVYVFWACDAWGMGKNQVDVVNNGTCPIEDFLARNEDPVAFLERAGAAIVAPSPTEGSKPTTDPIVITQPGGKTLASATITQANPNLTTLPASVKEFLQTHEIRVEAVIDGIGENTAGSFTLKAINKSTNTAYVGILSDPLEITSSDGLLKIKTASVSLLADPTTIGFDSGKAGSKTIHIKMGGSTVVSITFTVGGSAGQHASAGSTRFTCLYGAEKMKYFF